MTTEIKHQHKKQTIKDFKKEKSLFLHRSIVIGIFIILATGLLAFRLYYLQIIQHDHFTTLSDLNQVELIPITPNRGLIYDRNGVLLADNIAVFNLELVPDRIKNFNETLAALRQILPITDDDIKFYHKQAKQHRPFESVPLRTKLTDEERARFAVDQFRFPGVSIKARLSRHYPFGPSLSHALGYISRINEEELKLVDPINYSATNYIGKLGIEKFYEKQLHGTVGYERVEIDATGHIVRVMHRTPPVPGNNLYLSLDSQLMMAIEIAMQGKKGAVVAIDPRNGEILALVSNPGFDANLFVNGISNADYQILRNNPKQPLYNRAIRGQYPMASTIKPFMAVATLEYGAFPQDRYISDPGFYRLPGTNHTYNDWKKGGHGQVNLSRAVVVSCDTYFYTMASIMGIEKMHDLLVRFGFGALTGIDVHEELPGLIPNGAWKRKTKGEPWYPGDTVSAGIGQGYMLTTPLQLAQAVGVIAMHGERHQPHFLRYAQNEGDQKIPFKENKPKPMKLTHPTAWEYVGDAMRRVITDAGGTGYRFGRDAPYEVAAKTGTGQVFSAKFHKLNLKNLPEQLRDNSLFIAFAPKSNPEIAIAVLVENSHLASYVARSGLDYYFLKKWPTYKPDDSDPNASPTAPPGFGQVPAGLPQPLQPVTAPTTGGPAVAPANNISPQ